MADSNDDLEKLVQVFIAGFRFGPAVTAQDIRRVIDSEFTMLQLSLPDADAAEFTRLVDQTIEAIAKTTHGA